MINFLSSLTGVPICSVIIELLTGHKLRKKCQILFSPVNNFLLIIFTLNIVTKCHLQIVKTHIRLLPRGATSSLLKLTIIEKGGKK